MTYNEIQSVQTISLAVTQYPVSTKTISPVPSYGVGILASSAALYCSSWGARFFDSKPGAVVNNWIDTGINLIQKRLLSEKILKISAHDKQAHKQSMLYCSIATLLYWGVKASGQAYLIYKIGSVAQTMSYLGAHRSLWISQLIHSLQEQIKLIAILRTTKNELEQYLETISNPDLKAILVSHVAQTEGNIQRHSKIVSATIKKIDDMNVHYDKKLFNEECALGLKAVQEDFIKLVYGGIITRQDLHIIADGFNLTHATDQLYSIEQLMTQKDDGSCWRGIRVMQGAMQSLYNNVEAAMKKEQQIIYDALEKGDRLLSWQSFFKSIPIIRGLVS